jgi:hypothetical protein
MARLTLPAEDVEQEQRPEGEEPDQQPGIDVEHIGKIHGAKVRDPGDHRENSRIRQAEQDGSHQEAQETGDEVVQVALAATGGTRAWSEAGAGHADAENQATYEIANDVGRLCANELDQVQVF